MLTAAAARSGEAAVCARRGMGKIAGRAEAVHLLAFRRGESGILRGDGLYRRAGDRRRSCAPRTLRPPARISSVTFHPLPRPFGHAAARPAHPGGIIIGQPCFVNSFRQKNLWQKALKTAKFRFIINLTSGFAGAACGAARQIYYKIFKDTQKNFFEEVQC